MIVRITNRGHDQYGCSGIVYKESDRYARSLILFLKDNDGQLCIRAGFAQPTDYERIPDEEERDAFGWPPGLCDTGIQQNASDLMRLVKDGRKYRAIKELLKDER